MQQPDPRNRLVFIKSQQGVAWGNEGITERLKNPCRGSSRGGDDCAYWAQEQAAWCMGVCWPLGTSALSPYSALMLQMGLELQWYKDGFCNLKMLSVCGYQLNLEGFPSLEQTDLLNRFGTAQFEISVQ